MGYVHSCGLNKSFELICWGSNSDAQIDIPYNYKKDIRQVAAGKQHTCAIKEEEVQVLKEGRSRHVENQTVTKRNN